MSFLGILSALASGGATGLIGVFLQRFFDFKGKQQDLELVRINNEHARLLAQMDVDKARRRKLPRSRPTLKSAARNSMRRPGRTKPPPGATSPASTPTVPLTWTRRPRKEASSHAS